MLVLMTVFNIGWDWIFGRLGQLTFAWQGGMMSTLFTAWLFNRSNVKDKRP